MRDSQIQKQRQLLDLMAPRLAQLYLVLMDPLMTDRTMEETIRLLLPLLVIRLKPQQPQPTIQSSRLPLALLTLSKQAMIALLRTMVLRPSHLMEACPFQLMMVRATRAADKPPLMPLLRLPTRLPPRRTPTMPTTPSKSLPAGIFDI